MKKIVYREIERYKYQLRYDYHIKTKLKPKVNIVIDDYIILQTNGMLSIFKGYCWDGPSGPTIDTKNFMRGSLVHDALYQLMRAGLLDIKHRDYADRLLQKICKEDGMNCFRAWYVYQAVSKFAKSSAVPQNNEPKILEAP